MKQLSLLAAFITLAFMFCTTPDTVKKGDRFQILSDMQTNADVYGSTNYSETFGLNLPKGAVVEAVSPSNSKGYFECMVIDVNGKTLKEDIVTTLVPESVLSQPEFEYFSFNFHVKDIGVAIKKQ